MENPIYSFTFSNGCEKIKEVIPAEDWHNKYRDALQITYKTKGLKDNAIIAMGLTVEEVRNAESIVKELPSDFVVSDSPMGLSIETGVMILPECQGGEHKVIIKKIR